MPERGPAPPQTETELLERVRGIAGLRLSELAQALNFPPPGRATSAKGWAGELLERALGADAGNRPIPDFTNLGIELKTVPINVRGAPQESTYVCRAPSRVSPEMRWHNSLARHKLAHVLWLPVEAATETDIGRRRIGWGFLWRPNATQEALLQADWEELVELLATGRHEEINARLGLLMQLRPKARDASYRDVGADETGAPGAVSPRGFYLRARFTAEILAAGMTS